ncbi:MAG: hypothetical protein US96_C0034G0009 [Candidatus Woesebacteria bacterium GW2011_GWB1_38_5b]|uniref:Uncharacterized protein n=1 Tax=Candidatus Woesebacteria bacterium GW2011_GWB1_38_5b TaxID=1618569 RepID=A0A0G0K3Q2_9BACT|nr:MAG: hypothetical protein US96_C0034G0009 [Candidatus Woesebacteria bacterium GW2011_GWB1_38_5b]
MIIILKKRATKDDIKKMSEDFDGYIKLVVDIEKEILAGGGERHFEAEQKLINDGSHQTSLWGGGLDWDTREIDSNSILNLRPGVNPSRDILSEIIRKKFDKIVEDILL